MKRYAIANKNNTAYYSYGHETVDAAKEALIFAINHHDPFAHIVEYEFRSAEEQIQYLTEELKAARQCRDMAIADLYEMANCETCGYRGLACMAKTHEDEIDHSCYKWRGEMEFLNERRTDDD